MMGTLKVKCEEHGTIAKVDGVYRDNVDQVEQEIIEQHEKDEH